jgi:hypothetical protein
MNRKRTEFPSGADRADGLKIASWRERKRLVLVGLPRCLKSDQFKDSVRGCSRFQAAFRRESRSSRVSSQRTIRGAFQGRLRYNVYSHLNSGVRPLRSSSHPHSLFTRR